MGCLSLLFGIGALAVALVWGRPLPAGIWLLLGISATAFVGFAITVGRSEKRIAAYQKARNERAMAAREQVASGKNPSWPYFVYLRPFGIDGKFIEAPRQKADDAYIEEYGLPASYHDLESALALLVYPHSQLVALSDKQGRAGAGHVKSTEKAWKDDVRALCEHAEGIFVVPFDFEGTAWEVEMIMERGWLPKTFFVMPAQSMLHGWPGLRRFYLDYQALWEKGRRRYEPLKLPAYERQGAVVSDGDRVRVFKGFGSRRFIPKNRQRAQDDLETLRAILRQLSAANPQA
jgi:hypothetical protein